MLQGFCTAAHTVRTPPPQATRRCFTEEQIGAVMAGTLEGLIYLHRLNKIHRDIKAGPHAERTRASVARQLAQPPGAAPAPMGDQAWA